MKAPKKFWIQVIDWFLPSDWQKQSVIRRYRSRALVRSGIFGALLHPVTFFFGSAGWDIREIACISFLLAALPLALMFGYRISGRLRLYAILFLLHSTAVCAWAQMTAGTIHALYWSWVAFLIVFATLVLGVKAGAAYTVLSSGLFGCVLLRNVQQGPVLGHFLNKNALLSNAVLQILAMQLCFLLLMMAYDVIRNQTEVRAELLRFNDDEAARLASVGERMGGMAQDLGAQLALLQKELQSLETLAGRSGVKAGEVQHLVLELQKRTQKLSEISQRAHA